MIRDRVGEILNWQMQPKRVEAYQKYVDQAATEAEPEPPLPFNMDNYCMVRFQRVHIYVQISLITQTNLTYFVRNFLLYTVKIVK